MRIEQNGNNMKLKPLLRTLFLVIVVFSLALFGLLGPSISIATSGWETTIYNPFVTWMGYLILISFVSLASIALYNILARKKD